MERVTLEEQTVPLRRLRSRWLGRVGYRDAWALQRALAAARADGSLGDDQLLLLEHDAVLTLGRNAAREHVLALPELLAARGIEVIRVERGGEVTYHGPGQLVAYPIVGLAGPAPATGRALATAGDSGPRPIGVRAFVEALEGAMADTCRALGVAAGPRTGHPGCWVGADTAFPRKIGALGIRVARGVSFHGIALNITTNLADFDLIDPCGMPGLRSTSVAREREGALPADRSAGAPRGAVPPDGGAVPPDAGADPTPSTASVAEAAAAFAPALARRLGVVLAGLLPSDADPVAERRALDELVGTLAGAG